MTKADLVDKVTALGDLTRKDGEIIVDTLFEVCDWSAQIRRQDRDSRVWQLPDQAKKLPYWPKSEDGREGRRSRQARVPFFKPSKELRDYVNSKGAENKKVDAEHIDPHHPPAM